MLVLSRKKDECIVINNDITIVVVEIRGDKVRLGVEAPKEIPVHRKEVYEAIARDDGVDVGVPAEHPAEGTTRLDAGIAGSHPASDPPSASENPSACSPSAVGPGPAGIANT